MNPKIERLFFKAIFGLMMLSTLYVVGRCSYDSQQRIERRAELEGVR